MKNGYKKYTCTGAGGLWYNSFAQGLCRPPGLYSFYVKPFGAGNTGRFCYLTIMASKVIIYLPRQPEDR